MADPEFNFNSLYESFCEESGADEVPDLNVDQRIIILGSAVRDKLGSVALWLRDHSINIKLIELRAYKEDNEILIEPSVIVPIEVSKFTEVGRSRPERTPWITDGKSWHLEKRCSIETKELFILLDKILNEHLALDGPTWNQKYYVAYRVNNYNWLCVQTRPKFLLLDFYVKAKSFTSDDIAGKLKIAKFDKEEPLSEKLGLPSSVLVKERNENTDRIGIRVKSDFNLESPAFITFLDEAHKACPK